MDVTLLGSRRRLFREHVIGNRFTADVCRPVPIRPRLQAKQGKCRGGQKVFCVFRYWFWLYESATLQDCCKSEWSGFSTLSTVLILDWRREAEARRQKRTAEAHMEHVTGLRACPE